MVFLAGTGATAAWADRETGWSELAAREGFALALPEALPPDPTTPPSFLTNPPRWDDGSELRIADCRLQIEGKQTAGIVPSNPQSEICNPQSDDVAFLTAVLDDAVARFGVDARRVYMSGFSNGAGMAFRFAAERADRVAAVAPIAGHCWLADPRPARPVPTFYMAGTHDLLLPLRGGEVRSPWSNRLVRRPPVAETLERWARAIGCEAVPVLQSDDGTVRRDRYPGPVAFEALTITGLGHHWPGGGAQLNPRLAGPPSDAVNATETIWAFFRRAL